MYSEFPFKFIIQGNIMKENKVVVYTKINEHSCILDINSSVFLENTDTRIAIDSIIGDKYTHAQNCYF